jgi:hypothetical protein
MSYKSNKMNSYETVAATVLYFIHMRKHERELHRSIFEQRTFPVLGKQVPLEQRNDPIQ